MNKPQGIPVTFEEHAKLMFDLQGGGVPDGLDACDYMHDGT